VDQAGHELRREAQRQREGQDGRQRSRVQKLANPSGNGSPQVGAALCVVSSASMDVFVIGSSKGSTVVRLGHGSHKVVTYDTSTDPPSGR